MSPTVQVIPLVAVLLQELSAQVLILFLRGHTRLNSLTSLHRDVRAVLSLPVVSREGPWPGLRGSCRAFSQRLHVAPLASLLLLLLRVLLLFTMSNRLINVAGWTIKAPIREDFFFVGMPLGSGAPFILPLVN